MKVRHLQPESSWHEEPEWSPWLSAVQTPELDQGEVGHTNRHPTKRREQRNKTKGGKKNKGWPWKKQKKKEKKNDNFCKKLRQNQNMDMHTMDLMNTCSRGCWRSCQIMKTFTHLFSFGFYFLADSLAAVWPGI